MEWKNICGCGIVIGLLHLAHVAVAQELVPNGVFNYNDSCTPSSLPQVVIPPWFITLSTPDFYHPCFPPTRSVPLSIGGGDNPVSGEGYVGLYTFNSDDLTREFISIQLTESLVSGVGYHATFHVSRMDSSWYATRKIGLLFTQNAPEANLNYLLSVGPQVKHEGDTFLTNIHGWTRIEGSFVANGGERYLTIGNFDDDANTDTLFVPGGGQPPEGNAGYWSLAYYYVDGVSVIPDSVYLSTAPLIPPEGGVKAYPNPATENMTIEMEKWQNMAVELFDATGRIVLQQQLNSSRENIGVGHLPRGVYVAILQENGVVVERRKLILQ